MKIITLFLFFLSAYTFAQDYIPFDEDVPKRFYEIDDASANDYYFFSYQEEDLGDAIKFHQYFRRTGIEVPFGEYCSGWGATTGTGSDTTWLGREIRYDFTHKTLGFNNADNEAINFDFSLGLGDSALFYADASNEYYIKHTSLDAEDVYGVMDMVKIFTVLHYDLAEEPIASDLHGFEIKLGENLGLISFMDCLHFPEAEIGVTLQGQVNPTIGRYQMTYADIYPWEAGDVLQYRSTFNDYTIGTVYNRYYNTVTITDRVETDDSVFIYHESANFTIFYPGEEINPTVASFGYLNPLRFEKNKNISIEPSQMMPYVNDYQVSDSVDYCGMRERLTFQPDWLAYCDSCYCDIFQDGFGMTLQHMTYHSGLGMTSRHSEEYGGPDGTSTNLALIYSNVNGVECGEQIFSGIEEVGMDFKVYPNPASDQLQISTKKPVTMVRILGVNGAILYEELLANTVDFSVDVSELPKGIYVLELISDETRSFGKFVKE